MTSLSFKKKVLDIVLKGIDETIGKKYPVIDKLTYLFQENEIRFKKIEEDIKKLKESK